MIWLAVFPTLLALNPILGDWLPTMTPVVRTFVLATVAVPIVISCPSCTGLADACRPATQPASRNQALPQPSSSPGDAAHPRTKETGRRAMSSSGPTTTGELPQRVARDTAPRSPKRLARTAGVLYLLVALFGGFAQGFLEPRVYVPGDATATAGNVVANEGLVRLGVVSDLVNEVLLVLLALTLFALLNHVHLAAARLMVALALLAAGITGLNVVFEFAGVQVATGAVDMSALGVDGSDAMVLLMLDTQHYGLLIAQIFFGLWLAPLGYLAYQSDWFPKPLGPGSCGRHRLLPGGRAHGIPRA